MKRISIAVLLIIALFFTGCGTLFVKGGGDYRAGKRAYNDGKYGHAASLTLSALEKNPELEEATELLDKIVYAGTTGSLEKIKQLKASDNRFAYDKIWQIYAVMDSLHKVISESSVSDTYETKSFSEETAQAKQAAAEAHYKAGKELLAKDNFKSARKAAPHFSTARSIVSDYKDSAELYKQAKEESIAYVLVYSRQRIPELESRVQKAARENSSVTKYTKFLSANTIGIGAGLTASQVASKMENMADYIVYVGDISTDSDANPLSITDGNPIAGSIKTRVMSSSYTQKASAPYSVVATATGKVMKNGTKSASSSNDIEYTIMKSTGLETVNFGEGKKNWVYLYLNVEAYNTISPYISNTKALVDKYDREDFQSIQYFAELKKIVDGKTYNYDSNLLKFTNGQYSICYGDTYAESYRVKSEATTLLGSAITSAMKRLSKKVANANSGISDVLMDRIGKDVQGALLQ